MAWWFQVGAAITIFAIVFTLAIEQRLLPRQQDVLDADLTGAPAGTPRRRHFSRGFRGMSTRSSESSSSSGSSCSQSSSSSCIVRQETPNPSPIPATILYPAVSVSVFPSTSKRHFRLFPRTSASIIRRGARPAVPERLSPLDLSPLELSPLQLAPPELSRRERPIRDAAGFRHAPPSASGADGPSAALADIAVTRAHCSWLSSVSRPAHPRPSGD